MEQVINFMNELFAEMEGTHWELAGMAEYEEITEDGVVYARVEEYGEFEKQDNIYIHQTTGYLGDEHFGTIIKPITESVALVIEYEC